MRLVEFDIIFKNEWHVAVHFLELIWILLINDIFLVSKLKIPTLNTKWSLTRDLRDIHI